MSSLTFINSVKSIFEFKIVNKNTRIGKNHLEEMNLEKTFVNNEVNINVSKK